VKQIIGTFVLLPFEHLLNQIIARDRLLQQKLQSFSGKILQISSNAPSATLLIRFQADRLSLSALDAAAIHQQATASVTGSASDLFALLLNAAAKPVANPRISITGDALFVQDLLHALRSLDIDWKDYLAPLFGDLITQEAGQIGQQARRWGTQAQANLKRSVDEYVKAEIRLVPARAELELFNEQLDHLKLALDRLDARAQSIQARLDKSLKNQHLSS